MKRIYTLFTFLTFFSWISQAQPSTQATNINFSAVGINGFTINWTNGNGANRIVVVNSAAITFSPAASTTYAANTDFSLGTDLGSGQKCVFNGSGNSVAITGLAAGTQYFVRVFEYSGAAGAELYNVTTATNNPNSRFSLANAPSTDATGLTFSAITTTSMTVSLTPGNGSSRMLIAFNGAIGFVPVDGTSYTANSNFTTATNQAGNGKIVGLGTGNSFNVTNLTANTSYTFKVVEINGTLGLGSENYYNGGTPLTGSQSTVPNPPGTQASNITFSSPASNGFTINWTNGNGGNRIVVINSSAITFSPTAATTYTANTDFSTGTDLGSGQKCVFNGSGNSVTVTGLSPNTQYFVRVYEYNGAAGVESYNVNTATNNPNNRFSLESKPTSDATGLTFSAVTTTSMTVNLTPGNGSARMLIAFNGAIGFVPVDGTSYTANSNFTTATNQAGNGKIVGLGNGNSFNVTNLTANTSYTFKVVELNGTVGSGTENYYNGGTPLTGSQSTVPNPPGTQASNITFSSPASNGFTINWTNGNGGNRIVVINSSAITFSPTAATTYTANTDFSAGTDLGSGQKCVFNGSGNSVAVTGLSPNTQYFVRVYEYNGAAGVESYNVNTATNNPNNRFSLESEPTSDATGLTFSSVTTTSMTVNLTPGNGSARMLIAFNGAIGFVPVDGTSYTANSNFTTATNQAGNGKIVGLGTGNSFNVTNLTANTSYTFKVVELNGTVGSGTENYYNGGTPLTGSQSTAANAPSTQASNISFSSVTPTSMTITWTNGNGSNRIVLVREGSAVSTNPSDFTSYTASSNWAAPGSQIGVGNFVVYNGSGNSVSLTNLNPSSTYHVRVYEFSGTIGSGLENYNVNTASNNPNSQATVCAPPTVQATAITFGTINSSTIDLNWVRGNGNNVLVLARDGVAAAVNPTNGVSYTANAAFGTGTAIAISGNDYFAVYNGPATSVTVTNLNGSTAYNFKAFEYNTTNTCYLQTSPPSNDATTGSADNTSTLTLATGSVSISSIANTQPAAVTALQWTATDIGGDGISTRFTQLVVRPGPSNDITDFTQLILGAELVDNFGTPVQHGTAVIASNSITIPSINVGDINDIANPADLGTIPNNSSKIYGLKIWLKPSLGGTLPTTVDGLNLVLSVAAADFTTVPGRSAFVPASSVNSGATNNAIAVVATNLSFVQQPSTTANATIPLATQPILQSTDVNNNRDLGFNNAIASVNTGAPSNLNAAFTAFNFISGVATFTDLRFNSVGTSTMTVTSNSITSAANASPITVSASTNVTAGGLLGINAGPNLTNSTVNQAVFGFTLATTGTTLDFTDITITSTSDPDVAFKPGSIRLVRSTDNDFATAGNNTVVSSTYTTPGNSIDFSPFIASINGTPSYFFIVVDIQDSYPTLLPTIQLSLASTADFTVSLGGKTGATPITGINYTLQDATPPTVTSIASSSTVKLFGNQGITGTSVDFLVTFSEPIASGIDPGDFTISADPSVGYNATVGIAGSGNTRTVTINGISGTGRISLGLTDDNSILDVAGNTLSGASNGSVAPAYTGTRYYTITLPQPSNSVTGFSSSATSNTVTVNWNDAVAPAQQATHYLVRIKKSTSTFSPVTLIENTNDGIDYTDTNFADGTLATYVPYDASPTGTVTFNVTSGSTYNVEIYPLTYTANYGVADWDYRFTSPLTGSESTPVSFLSSAVLNTLVVPISSLKTTAGNSADVMQFRIFDDGQDPILPNVMTLQLNGAGTERIIFKLREQLSLNEGDNVTGFTTSTGSIATAVYTGKGTTNTITLTSTNNGDWNSTTTVSYSGSGNAIFSTLGPLQIINAHPVAQAADQVVTFNTNGTFIVPAGVTNITVETWGGGGAGGAGVGGAFFDAGGGGGGGGYSRSYLTVVPGSSFGVTVGTGGPVSSASGTASNFGSGLVVALGGQGGGQNTGSSAGSGGAGAGLGIGEVVFAGGAGRSGFFGGSLPASAGAGGGGGSSAGISANGNTTTTASGANAPLGGGDGGNGINIGSGQIGSIPGGGGGGSGNGLGGDGANGRVRITYSDPAPLTGASDWDGDNADFKFSQLVINQGIGNSNGPGEVANWQDIIEAGGAQLSDGTNTFTGTVNPTNITFSSIPSSSAANIGFIADANGAPSSKTYTLKIWLKPNLSSALAANIDGLNLAFSLSPASFSYNDGSGQSSRFLGSQPDLQSGAKEIEVVATKLDFTTSPNPTQLVLAPIASASVAPDLSATGLIRARDVNGNTDKDYSAPLTVTGAVAATLPATVNMTNGKANLAGVQYQIGGDGTLTATTATAAANSLVPASGASTPVTVIYSNLSTIVPGNLATPALFSSLNTSSFVQVFDFRVVDDNGSGGDGSPTRISQIVYTQGTGNDITDWTQAISQAQLWDGVLANPPIIGTVSANSITFSGINPAGLGFINDNGFKNYRLYITLKSSLGGTLPNDIDTKNFVFEVLESNIGLTAQSSLFTGSESENSGAANIAVNVVASKLQFDVNPLPVLLVGKDISSQPPVPVVEALDVFNNRDINYNSSTVTVTNSLGLTMGNIPGNGSIINGVLTFPNNFKFNTSGIGATLTVAATGPSAVSSGTSTPFDVRGGNATTITAGALAEPAIVSSLTDLVNTPAGLAVFDFTINDDPGATPANENDGNATQLNAVTITSGAGNTVLGWNDAIATATLSDGTNTVTVTTIDPSNYLYFDLSSAAGQQLGLITDNNSKTFTLRIWLKSALGGTLPTTIDGLRFVFDVQKANISLSANGTNFAPTPQTQNSGIVNNLVDVVATKIDFTTPVDPAGPTTATASLNSPLQVVAQARDINGNRDLGFSSAITVLSNASGATMTSTPAVVGSNFAAGVFNFPADFKFITGTNGDNVTLSMSTSSGVNSVAFPAPFTPEIRLISSFESTLTFNPVAPDPTIDYVNYQGASNVTSANSVILETLTLTDGDADGDADGANTTLNSVTFSITNPSNINRIALYDATGLIEIAEQLVGGASSITFSGLSIAAVDTQGPTQGVTNFVIRATFNNTATDVHDLDLIQLRVTAAVLGVGSKFVNDALSPTPSPSFIGGVNNGSLSPVQNIAVTATSLDFTLANQPSQYAGVNEPVGPTYTTSPLPSTTAGVVLARDIFQIIDTEFAPTTIELKDAAGNTLIKPTGLAFSNGLLNLDGMQYPVAVGNQGAVSVITTLPNLNSSTGAFACQTVNVLEVLGTFDSNNGVVTASSGTAPLKGGFTDIKLFGIKFTATTAGTEPQLSSFKLNFKSGPNSAGPASNWYRDSNNGVTVFSNFRVLYFNGTALVNITSSFPGSTVTEVSTGSNGFFDQINVVLGSSLQITSAGNQFILVADVDPSTNSSTQTLIPYFIDAGYNTPSDKNSVVTNGTSIGVSNTTTPGEVAGAEFSFASTQPPTLRADKKKFKSTSTSPYLAQSNVSPSLNKITLEFDTNVGVLDNISNNEYTGEIWSRFANKKVADLILNTTDPVAPYTSPTTPAAQGTVSGQTLANIYPRLIFNIVNKDALLLPGGNFVNDEVYFVKLRQGSYDPVSQVGHGISDFGLNFYGGISDNSTLYFKIASANAPKLLSAKSTFNTRSVGSLTTAFDAFGTAYYLIIPNGSGAPTINQIKGITNYTGSVANGSFKISSVGSINPANNNVTGESTISFSANYLAATDYDVYIFAENDALPPVSAAGSYGPSPNFTAGSSLPTLTIPSSAISFGTPVATPSNPAGKLVLTICPDSYVTLQEPLIIGEINNNSFFSRVSKQDFNILLPQGFEFDVTVPPVVDLIGNDFKLVDVPNSKKFNYKYKSNSLLNIEFLNTGSTSTDFISISGLSVKGTSGSTQGPIQWFYGDNVYTPTKPVIELAQITFQSSRIPDFTNSYWYNNNLADSNLSFPYVEKSLTLSINNNANSAFDKTVNNIPDNFLDPGNPGAVRLLPMTPPYIKPSTNDTFAPGDYLASIFSGNGVSGDLLTLNAVTTGAAFNITISHTDLNGCTTSRKQQYLIYDHNSPISKKLGATMNASVDQVTQQPSPIGTKQDIINASFIGAASDIPSQTILYNELAGYSLIQLNADLPTSEIVLNNSSTQSRSQFISGPDWRTLIRQLLTNTPDGPNASTSFNNYTWNYGKILKASAPALPADKSNVYDYFIEKASTSGNTYWKGGSLGKIEFTGIYQSTADQTVFAPFRQSVELFVPAVPLIEVTSPKPFFDNSITEISNTSLPEFNFNTTKYSAGSGYPGTATFCESDAIITLNAFPVASGGTSTGFFQLYDFNSYKQNIVTIGTGTISNSYNTPNTITGTGTSFNSQLKVGTIIYVSASAIGVVTSIQSDTKLTYSATANTVFTNSAFSFLNPIANSAPNSDFVDNANGTMTLKPSQIKNNYDNILVTYTYQDNNSPAVGTGYLVIRVTPNPVAKFTIASSVAGSGLSGSAKFDGFCLGNQISFDASPSSISAPSNSNTPANSIASYRWDFGDPNSGTPNTPSGPGGAAVTAVQPQASSIPQTYDKPVHFYNTSSTFTVNLTLTSKWGCSSIASGSSVVPVTQTADVLYAGSRGDIAIGEIPIPKFTFLGNCAEDDINFDASTSKMPSTPSTGNATINRYDWDFDLANSTPAPTPKTSSLGVAASKSKYPKSGFYNVQLTAFSTLGCKSSSTQYVAQLPKVVKPSQSASLDEKFSTTDGGWISIDLNQTSNQSTIPSQGSWKYAPLSNSENLKFEGKGWTTGPYLSGEKSALYTACLDLSTVPRPMISFDSYIDLNTGEGLVVQYSTDDKNILDPTKNWTVLGDFSNGFSSGLDWYDFSAIPSSPGSGTSNPSGYGWSKPTTPYPNTLQPKHKLENVGSGKAILRFALSALNAGGKGVSIDNIRVGSRTRTILFENFTTTDDNGNTTLRSDLESDAAAISAFNNANINSTQIVNINYHIGFVGSDPFNLDNPADPSSRALYYNVSKVPYALLDGEHRSQYSLPTAANPDLFGNWGQKAYDLQTLKLAQADFTGTTVKFENDSIKVNVKATNTTSLDLPKQTSLYVAILETSVLKNELKAGSKVTTNETVFPYVLKKLLPNAVGTKLASGKLKATVNSVPLPPVDLGTYGWRPSPFYSTGKNYSVVVFLQNDSTKEVYQAELNPGKLPTDNPSDYQLPGPITGIEPLSPESVNIYPNPANQEFVIELPNALSVDSNISLVDQMGKTIDGGILPAGRTHKSVGTYDLAAGVYIVQIKTDGGDVVRKKVVIVH